MATIHEKAAKIKQELDAALNDERYRNLSFVAGGNLTSGAHSYLRRHTEKIARLALDHKLCLRIQRIINGEVFTLKDIWECQADIREQYPQYVPPIHAQSGILFSAEAIRKSFGKRYYLILYKYPIKIDFGTPNGKVYIIHPSNFLESYTKEEQAE